MELSGSNIEKIIFQETETLKRFLISWKIKLFSSNIKKFFVFSQNRVVFIFRKMETPSKKFLLFQETEFSYILGNVLYFRREFETKAETQN